jgi:hypothetical protein
MLARIAVVVLGWLGAGSAMAEPLSADAARSFVIGKMFGFNCFDGTRGAGRVYGDGSVAGNVQFRGNGQVRFVTLPPGTILIKGEAVCASMRGLPMEPCFNLVKTDPQSFRGSLAGLGFAYCDFSRRNTYTPPLRTTFHVTPSNPLSLQAAAGAPDAE